MGVSQQSIADRLGLSRTTVTKILNRDPKYSASRTTRDKVFRVAEEMGYDFTTIRRPFKREYGRTEVNAVCAVRIFLEDDSLFDSGKAVARNIGVGGALLVDLDFPKMSMPLHRFYFQLDFLDIPELMNVRAECQVVRIADSSEADKPELGVKFININDDVQAIIKRFVDMKIEQENAQRTAERALRQKDITPLAMETGVESI